MNAIDFLIKEHDKVRKMLTDISDSSHQYETKRKLFDKLCADLLRHETMEEEVWYPQLKRKTELYSTIKHLISEEKHAEKEIKTIQKITDQAEWENKFLTFKKNVEHHAKEEEEKLFPQVKKILSEKELEEIGKEMFTFKQQYQE